MLAPVSTPILLHITSAEQWNVAIADGVLIDPSLEREGFKGGPTACDGGCGEARGREPRGEG